jgi:hypothetical protein
MIHDSPKKVLKLPWIGLLVLSFLVAVAGTASAASNFDGDRAPRATPKFSQAVAFDVSPPVRLLAAPGPSRAVPSIPSQEPIEIRPDRGPVVRDRGYSGDDALQKDGAQRLRATTLAISAPMVNFEGISNQDNFNLYGGRVNPPDPDGDVGPNHYVQMVNLAFAIYDKAGNLLTGPTRIGDLWNDFAVEDCTDPSGDPIVLYDRLEDRWLLSQFTTRGPEYWNCVAISTTADPTGSYYRYAFSTTIGDVFYFPDYPKYGNWKKSYVLTSRDFGDNEPYFNKYGISVYALEKNKMIAGDPGARAVRFFLDADVVPINLIGDGLLPADFNGTRLPKEDAPIPVVGTQDDDGPYGATFDALNIWELSIQWKANPVASLMLNAQLPVAAFDSAFPCAPTSRDCLPQPGITDPRQYLDILSYRQRPTWRLAYRNFGTYESMVTNQSVEALPGVAGARWYEIRRINGEYSLYQQGTYAPNDGVHRWMGSIAQDAQGNLALGYSVVNGTNVYPGIRYTGRLAGDPLGQMTLGEGTIINGTGVQRTTNSRWGDYTSMNVDPSDDCTFWYTNEYYTLAGQQSSTAGWQTRIASFKFPGCVASP